MLFLSALLTSLDSFFIGWAMKEEKRKFYPYLLLYFFLFCLYTLFLLIMTKIPFPAFSFHLQFHLFLILALLSLKEKKEKKKTFSWPKLTFIFFTNSLDGLIISASFLSCYNFFTLSFLFTNCTFLLFLVGLKIPFKIKKRKNILCLLFLFLAILSLF